MLKLMRQLGDRFKEVGSVLWRCFYSVTLTLLGVAKPGFRAARRGVPAPGQPAGLEFSPVPVFGGGVVDGRLVQRA
ncbi:hypothetical protein LP419_06910 [Massilia sp. H-1]|nr:hypothetical protein LP419_06910 [Massilia sp. H-1]